VVVPEIAAPVSVGAAKYVKPLVEVTLPFAVVTTTFTLPAVPEGVVTVTEVDVLFVIDVPEFPPKVTPETLDKFVPVIVTVVTPPVAPEDGEIDEIDAAPA
jgi:hypothetical protein